MLKSRNLPNYVCFWVNPHPPLGADFLNEWSLTVLMCMAQIQILLLINTWFQVVDPHDDSQGAPLVAVAATSSITVGASNILSEVFSVTACCLLHPILSKSIGLKDGRELL